MIEFFTAATPNGRKISCALEELQLPYTLHKVNLAGGDQLKPEFLALNPNNKIPVIVDKDPSLPEPVTVFESGAILIYLARKAGRLLPQDPLEETQVLQWLMFQMAGVGPMFGQWVHFTAFAKEKNPYAIERFYNESHRLLRVIAQHLKKREYFAEAFSIADLSVYPWIRAALDRQLMKAGEYPVVEGWMARLEAKPSVAKGMKIP